ncbi:MAG: TolB protein [Candidatus Sericytochromatia bacterium]|nr:MAG: TolB protein [Candidatus Sericytochromatia bacterium]
MKKFLIIIIFTIFFLSTNSKAQENKEEFYLKNIEQLTYEGEKSGEAYFSADGKKIIFQSVRGNNPHYQIYTMDIDGKNQKMVSTGKGKTTCAFFSPKSRKIIYSSSHLDESTSQPNEKKESKYSWDFEKSMDIFEANIDGSNLKRLTFTEGYDAEGTYSNDGKYIVFTSQRDNDLEIYIMNSDGTNQKRLTYYKGYDGGAFFSPDDKKIVFRRFDDKGNSQIFLIDRDGKNEKQLTNMQGVNWCPAFHPSGKYIIFSSNFHDKKNFDLFLMDIEGNNIKQLTFNKASDILPYFSPDGKKLMWTSTRNNNKSQIFIADFNTNILNDYSNYSKNIFEHVKYLSSDELEGRRAGTESCNKAASYIFEQFKRNGIKNVKYQNFEVTTNIELGNNNYLKINDKELEINKDFIPLNFSDNNEVESNLVFVGYGISAEEYKYDDYKDIDVKDKIVLILRHEPGEKDEKSIFNGNKPTQYSEIRYKIFNAKKHGAKGIILINGSIYDDNEDELIKLKNSNTSGNLGIPVIQVKNNIFNEIFNLKEIQENIDKNYIPNSFDLKVNVNLKTDLIRKNSLTKNVIAFIEGKDKNLKNEIILIGAHYDHLGYGGDESLDTLKDVVHNGADDNASGVSALIELSNKISKLNTKRSVAFIAFSAEELGLIGSSYFINHPIFENKKIISMINMDMIGRLEQNKLHIGGYKTAKEFEKIINNVNKKYNFKLSLSADGYGPSDHMSFYSKDIPVLFFFTGVHLDYHKSTDDYNKINFGGIQKITNFVYDIIKDIDNLKHKPTFVKLAPSKRITINSGKSNSVYLGTIPDYSSMDSNIGVLISGVREDSPAEKGGIKAGDIIIEFNSIKINNIYDYTYALRDKKPGEKVKIKVKRDNQIIELEVKLGKK